jgi:hypothetical protein
MSFPWKKLAYTKGDRPSSATPRRSRRMEFSWDNLEERKVLSHGGGLHHHLHAAAAHVAASTTTTATAAATTVSAAATTVSAAATTVSAAATSTSTSTTSTLSTARATLQKDIQTIESNSGTTIGELTTIHTTFETLEADGLTPSSKSALDTFENSLVTSFASGTTLTGNATLLAQFEALYTSTPTTQQTTDLTAAYNALAAAVTSSNITSANITTINTDFAAVLAAESSTSTATFPYFSLVTGQAHGLGVGGGGCS